MFCVTSVLPFSTSRRLLICLCILTLELEEKLLVVDSGRPWCCVLLMTVVVSGRLSFRLSDVV